MKVFNKINTILIKYFCVITFNYIFEVSLIIYIKSYMGYSAAFLVVRPINAILFFLLAKYFVFKSKGNSFFEFRNFCLLMSLNIILIESYIFFVDISSEFYFVLSYTLIHGFLFIFNYLILNYKIFFR